MATAAGVAIVSGRWLMGLGTGLLLAVAPVPPAAATGNGVVPVAQAQPSASAMTPERLAAILEDHSAVRGLQARGERQWQFRVGERPVTLLVDPGSDHMRLVASVAPVEQVSAEQVQNVLVANFHTALDARYAVAGDRLVSVFLHPLSSLQADDFRSAVRQVARLAATFGTSYSSGEMVFGPGRQSPDGRPERNAPSELPDLPELEGESAI